MIIGTAIAAFLLGMAFTLVVFVLNGNPVADRLTAQLTNSREKESRLDDQRNRLDLENKKLLEQVESQSRTETGMKTDIKSLNDRLDQHQKNWTEFAVENDARHRALREEQEKVQLKLCQIGNLEGELRTKEQSLAGINAQLEEQRTLVGELRETIRAKSGRIEELESVIEDDNRKLNEIQRTLNSHAMKT